MSPALLPPATMQDSLTLGALLTLGAYATGALVFFLAARRRRLATEGMGYVALAGLCGGLIGARVTEWMVVHWPQFAAQPGAMLDPRSGGRTLIGGVIIGWLCVEVAKWRLGIRRSTGDLFALALPAGEAVGRIGCYFNTCCHGVPADIAWAVHQHGAWRHPAQLYSAAAAAALFGVLLLLRDCTPGLSLREGDLFRAYLLLFGLSRFALEFTRERSIAFGGLSLAQWTCLEMAAVSALTLAYLHRRALVLAPPLPTSLAGEPLQREA